MKKNKMILNDGLENNECYLLDCFYNFINCWYSIKCQFCPIHDNNALFHIFLINESKVLVL